MGRRTKLGDRLRRALVLGVVLAGEPAAAAAASPERTDDPEPAVLLPAARQVLTDPEADELLRGRGFARLPGGPVLTEAAAAELRAQFLRTVGDAREGWHCSFNSSDLTYRAEAWRAIEAAVGEAVGAHFVDHEAYQFGFLCKWPGERSAVPVHQDWTFHDRSSGLSTYGVMVALGPIGPDDGPVSLVPMSHRHTLPVCGQGMTPDWDPHAAALAAVAVDVPLETGSAVAWDVGTIHHGTANRSDEPRVALLISLRPRELPLFHHRRLGPTEGAAYPIDDAFFRDETPESLAADPTTSPARRFSTPDDDAAADDLAGRVQALLDDIAASPWRRDDDAPPPPPAPAANMAW